MSADALKPAPGLDREPRRPGGQEEAPYLDAIVDYARRRPGRFHVPGHKGGAGADQVLVAALGRAAFEHDIPAGIEGIDVGPDSPFQRAQRLAADAWGARRSWFLVSGASQGNHAACLALRHSGRPVVVQRNVHSSTVDGIILAGLEPTFVAPEVDPELGVAHCLAPEALADALHRTPDAVAALTVSPTYFGAVADVRGLAAVARGRGVPLVVDEAWGSHLRFSPLLPESALECGADLVLSSVHKLFGSLTQSAILHLGRAASIDDDVVDRCVTLTESTSPSALLTASLDAALGGGVEILGAEEQVQKRPFAPPPPWGRLEMPPREAFLGPQEVVAFPEAVGRLAAESLAAYPPGVPNVLPGERLSQETVDYIREAVEQGGWVRGAVDRSLR